MVFPAAAALAAQPIALMERFRYVLFLSISSNGNRYCPFTSWGAPALYSNLHFRGTT